MRINRYLAVCGVGSRRKVEPLILQGHVYVNGAPVRDLSYQVQEGDEIEVFGAKVYPPSSYRVLAFYKPKNYLCTRTDPQGRETIYDILPEEFKNFQYVGRLDYNTHGLLLLTDDGELAQRLTRPEYKVERTYELQLDRTMTLGDIQKMAEGVFLPADRAENTDVTTLPASGEAYGNKLSLTLTEGKNREIRRMMQVLGYEVYDLFRVQYGPISIEGIAQGDFRELSDEEIGALVALVGLE